MAKQKTVLNILKVVLLGDQEVGKTAIFNKLENPDFVASSDNYQSTIGVGFASIHREIEKNNEKIPVKFQVWDTAGQERLAPIGDAYIRGSHIACIVIDARNTKDEKLQSIKKYIQKLEKNCTEFTPKIHLIVNRIDKEGVKAADALKEEINALIKDHSLNISGVSYCSAKTGKGFDTLEAALVKLAEQCLNLGNNVPSQDNIPPVVIKSPAFSWQILGPAILGLKKHFRTSHAVRNGFLIGLLAVIGIVLTSALSGPFALLIFFGVAALTGAMVAAVSGALAFIEVDTKFVPVKDSAASYLADRFFAWMKKHQLQTWIGIGLFLATTALIVTALIAPGPLLVAIGFVGSSFAAMGLTLSTPAVAILTFALMGITAMALLDAGFRIWEAISSDKNVGEELPFGRPGVTASAGNVDPSYNQLPGTGNAAPSVSAQNQTAAAVQNKM